MENYIFTSESVCSGHPDKICDQVSDAIVDSVLEKDPMARVAVETLVTQNRTILAGEISSNNNIDIEKTTRTTIKQLGYTKQFFDYTYRSPIDIYIHQQSKEIAAGVNNEGAGDQGMMFGFACTETESYMPLPITIAHALTKAIDEARESKKLSYLYPDGKSQITIEYKNNLPYKVQKVVIAVPHSKKVGLEQVSFDIFNTIIVPVLQSFGHDIQRKNVIVNGTGVWHQGGPASDTGLTGRKIIVDTYGGYARVGGGCFSGKDPTKVDRSGAYAARFLAKNIVANKLAEKVEVSLAYCIGVKKPVMQEIETFGTEKTSIKVIKSFMDKLLDTSVNGIIEALDLKKPRYQKTASYGHFGREEFPWEKIINL